MAPVTVDAFVAAFPAARIASGLNIDDPRLAVLLGGARPDWWTSEDENAVTAARARAQVALDDASALVAAALAGRYNWSAASAAPAVAAITRQKALERLHGDDIPKGAAKAARRADRALEALADGSASLLDASGARIPQTGRVRTLDEAPPAMGGVDLSGFPRPGGA